MALGYTLVGLLVGGGLLLGTGIVVALWLAVRGMRPELLEKSPPDAGSGSS